MAYVRTKGNQVLLVHGARNADTGAVEQETIFTFYTKAEIEAAVCGHCAQFRNLVESNHPDLRFNWNAINAALRKHEGDVPDVAPPAQNAENSALRDALVELARVVWELEPEGKLSAWQLVDDNRATLTLVIEQLRRLLLAPAPADSKYTRDAPTIWRQAAKPQAVPLRGWEQLDHLWNRCRYDEVEALAGLLAEAFPRFADAHNHLGHIAMERGDVAVALKHYIDAEETGRKQFPRRIAKSRYWSDHDTRPFLRSLMYQVAAHNRLGAFKEALELCDRLERDYGQDISAEALRTPVLLNDSQWQEAARVAQRLVGIYPEHHFLLAFASLELGGLVMAREHFVCGALQLPATGALLLKARLPKGIVEDSRDHNGGVGLLRDLRPYLSSHAKSLKTLRQLWSHPVFEEAIVEAELARQNWRANRSADRTWFDEVTKMRTFEYARTVSDRIEADGGGLHR